MFQRCLLILLVASLVASAGAAWASSVFVDSSATASYEEAWPTGVSQTGGVIMNGLDPSQSNLFYAAWAYPAGTTGTMYNADSLFTTSGGTMHRAVSTSMSNNGNATLERDHAAAHDGFVVTGTRQLASPPRSRTSSTAAPPAPAPTPSTTPAMSAGRILPASTSAAPGRMPLSTAVGRLTSWTCPRSAAAALAISSRP